METKRYLPPLIKQELNTTIYNHLIYIIPSDKELITKICIIKKISLKTLNYNR